MRQRPRRNTEATVRGWLIGGAIALFVVSVESVAPAQGAANERSGSEIVAAHCASCHQAGTSGAPKIGDRSAWIARARRGLDPLVVSAMKGHGAMPARGGLADLSDSELRNAVIYMLNSGSGASSGQDYRVVAGTTIEYGVMPANTMRAQAKQYPASIYGEVPTLPNHYYVTVAAFDARSGQRITDAVVRASVSGAAGAGREQTLKPITVGNAVSYGGYFAMAGGGPYKVSVRVMRPGSTEPASAQFQYTP